jgi:RNA polymerase sigma-70 factor, ECF subfamily
VDDPDDGRAPAGTSRRSDPDRVGDRRRSSASANDDTLVDAARDGDAAAVNALLARHYERVYAICRRMTGNDHDALDATQDALIAIARGLPRYDGRAAFSTWAYRVTTNACLDELRRRRRRPVASLDERIEPRGQGEPDIDDVMADRLVIDAALAQLSPEFRAAVVLRDVIGLDYAEIAAVLDIPPGTVRSRIARGRRALADHISGNPSRAHTVGEGTHD